jgi:hypothetical protein
MHVQEFERKTTMPPVSEDRQVRTSEKGTQQTGQQDVVEKSKGEDKDNADMKKLQEFAKTQGNNDSCRVESSGFLARKKEITPCYDNDCRTFRMNFGRTTSACMFGG